MFIEKHGLGALPKGLQFEKAIAWIFNAHPTEWQIHIYELFIYGKKGSRLDVDEITKSVVNSFGLGLWIEKQRMIRKDALIPAPRLAILYYLRMLGHKSFLDPLNFSVLFDSFQEHEAYRDACVGQARLWASTRKKQRTGV